MPESDDATTLIKGGGLGERWTEVSLNWDGNWYDSGKGRVIEETDFAEVSEVSVRVPFHPVVTGLQAPFHFYPTAQTKTDLMGEHFRYPGGWLRQQEFGWIYDFSFPWINLLDHGWWYRAEAASTPDLWWVYDQALGWTAVPVANAYPYLWADGRWLYYLKGTFGPRWFYDYRIGDWVAIE